MQAIKTVYLAPTNTKPTRIKASCPQGSVTLSYDHEFNSETNHHLVATALAKKLNWLGGAELVSGQLTNDVYVHTFSRVLVELKVAVFETRKAIKDGSLSGNPHTKPFGQAITKLTDGEYGVSEDYNKWLGGL